MKCEMIDTAHLCHIELHTWLIIIIRVQVLNIGIIHHLSKDSPNLAPVYLTLPHLPTH